MLQKHILVRYSKKTGKIDTTMEGLGNAMMRLWAMNNTTSSKEVLIFNKETGEVVFHTIGKKNDFPTIEDKDLGHINEYCEGLLEALA